MGAEKIFGHKTEEIIKSYDEELHCLHPPPDTVQVIKLKKMNLMGHVAYTEGR
jgi:hypothetical protein